MTLRPKAISRRNFLTGSAALGALAGFSGGLAAGTNFLTSRILPPKRPNLILVIADDMRWDAMGVAGNRVVQTPCLDKLAADGIYFTRTFATTGVCPVSRASIYTGQHARRHRVWDFAKSLSSAQLAATFPSVLRRAGYSTGFIGKWGIGINNPMPTKLFDFFSGFQNDDDYYSPSHPDKHLGMVQAEQAIRFIASQKKSKPFLLVLSFRPVHDPFIYDRHLDALYRNVRMPRPTTNSQAERDRQPAVIRALSDKLIFANDAEYGALAANYYRMVTGLDNAMQSLVTYLQNAQLGDDTCMLFTSDNSLLMGEHGIYGKSTHHEEAMRVPTILTLPPAALSYYGGPARKEQLTLNIDIAPTLLDLAGVSPPRAMQGRSLIDTLRPPQSTAPWRSSFLFERQNLYDFPEGNGMHAFRGIHTDRWKYTEFSSPLGSETLLFDLANDPFEQINRTHMPNLQALQAQLRSQLSALIKEAT